MEQVLIIGCKNVMDDVCVGCSRCLTAFNRREGTFSIYKGKDVQLVGLLGCGGCPGAGIVPRLAQMKLWNVPMNVRPTKVHIASCLSDHCPHAEDIITKIMAKSGVECIEGGHPYIPEDLFA